ncbi:UDP-glycosyltransferase 73B1-like isoform X1 [Typha angustifolia]|uniref:UDP-glycosyltransferase 73B1-like isoform X1 n=1 Tax=Typha angustifolia TaxID=59011 RepID=UPI003C2CB8C4
MANNSNGDHVIIFPFMAKGHTIPLLHLSGALSSRGLRVTLVTTPVNAPFFYHRLHYHESKYNVVILTLPFPHHPPLPLGVESTDLLPSPDLYPTFIHATTLLRQPFHDLLLNLSSSSSSSPPLCLISDFFLGWTQPICSELGIPRLVFHGMSAFSMSICKSLFANTGAFASEEERYHVPGTPPSLLLTKGDIPKTVLSSADLMTRFLDQVDDADLDSWGVVVNSFADVEEEVYVKLLESFYRRGARAWMVGPMSLLAAEMDAEEDDEGCIGWLDEQLRNRGARSVVYVAFGTQAHVTDEQLDEVAHGLSASGYAFLWVVRSKTWVPPFSLELEGKVVGTWAPQKQVLRHVAVGGFISHCGWNSVLESVSAGVPMLTWPMIAEQALNAKHVVDVLGVGVNFGARAGEIVRREEVTKGVNEVMGGGEKGRRARERVADLRREAEEAVKEGGSSDRALDELLEELRKGGRYISKASAG